MFVHSLVNNAAASVGCVAEPIPAAPFLPACIQRARTTREIRTRYDRVDAVL